MKVSKYLYIVIAFASLLGCNKTEKIENSKIQEPTMQSLDGKYERTEKTGKIEIGGIIEIENLKKPTNDAKYKGHFNGYYSKDDMPNVCDFEGEIIQVTNNVFSFKNKNDDVKFNLILIKENKELIIFATDVIDGCGSNSELAVPGKYKLQETTK